MPLLMHLTKILTYASLKKITQYVSKMINGIDLDMEMFQQLSCILPFINLFVHFLR